VSQAASIELRTEQSSCTLWLEACPSYAGLATACIGHFRCDDEASGRMLLDRAATELARRGMQYAVGPMDGDTWHAYRLVTHSDGSPPFALEPFNPAFYPMAFADFEVIGRYCSARTDEVRRRNVTACEARLHSAGIHLRSFDMQHAERDLLDIHQLSLRAFARNLLYTPIGETAFMDLYRPLLGRVDPKLILMAEDESLQAFLFAIPDRHNVVVKTYASLRPGLGAYLAEQLQSGPAARYEKIIHALMHDDNVSRRNSSKYAATFRRYAIYGRRL
jgi:hypothetical protein